MNRASFPKEKTPEFKKMGEVHELFLLALSLVWFVRVGFWQNGFFADFYF